MEENSENTSEPEEILNRFNQIIEHAGGTQTALSNKTGLSQGNIGAIVRGIRKITGSILVGLLNAGYSADWLMLGVGNMLISQNQLIFSEKSLDQIKPLDRGFLRVKNAIEEFNTNNLSDSNIIYEFRERLIVSTDIISREGKYEKMLTPSLLNEVYYLVLDFLKKDNSIEIITLYQELLKLIEEIDNAEIKSRPSCFTLYDNEDWLNTLKWWVENQEDPKIEDLIYTISNKVHIINRSEQIGKIDYQNISDLSLEAYLYAKEKDKKHFAKDLADSMQRLRERYEGEGLVPKTPKNEEIIKLSDRMPSEISEKSPTLSQDKVIHLGNIDQYTKKLNDQKLENFNFKLLDPSNPESWIYLKDMVLGNTIISISKMDYCKEIYRYVSKNFSRPELKNISFELIEECANLALYYISEDESIVDKKIEKKIITSVGVFNLQLKQYENPNFKLDKDKDYWKPSTPKSKLPKDSTNQNNMQNPIVDPSATNVADNDDYILIPKYDIEVSAGEGITNGHAAIEEHQKFLETWIRNTLRISPRELVMVSASGDSMEPTIGNNDSLLVKSDGQYTGDGVYVIRVHDAVFSKRIRKRLMDGGFDIISDNDKYPTESIAQNHEGFAIIGKVLWIGRTL